MDARSSGSRWLGRAGLALGLLLTGGLIVGSLGPRTNRSRGAGPLGTLPEPSAEPGTPELDPDPAERRMLLPRGSPPRISCAEAQRATLFLARELAAPAIAPTAAEFAPMWSALLDPHGLWSAAPDSPLFGELERSAPAMLASLHERSGGCAAADDVGRAFEAWSSELGQIYDAA